MSTALSPAPFPALFSARFSARLPSRCPTWISPRCSRLTAHGSSDRPGGLPASAGPAAALTPALVPAALMLATLSVAVAQPAVQDLDLRVQPSDIAPSVTIQEHDNRTVQEYSVNGNTYMIKVTPTVGVPYYLVDTDGSGDMEWRRNSPGLETQPPQWSLFSW